MNKNNFVFGMFPRKRLSVTEYVYKSISVFFHLLPFISPVSLFWYISVFDLVFNLIGQLVC